MHSTRGPVTIPCAKPVAIRVSNQQGFLWNVEDIRTLRVQHHICGAFTGTLPQVGQQNVFLGLPLALLPEEVVLLVKNKIAFLVDDRAAHKSPTSEQTAKYKAARSASIRLQQNQSLLFEEEKRIARSKAMQATADNSRAQLQAIQTTELIGKSSPTDDSANPASSEVIVLETSPVTDLHEQRVEQREQIDPLATIPYTVIIEPSSDAAPWYHPKDSSYHTLEAAEAADLWNYPSTPLQSVRCRVFEDLWKKGKFMGVGLRFGGDFLVYPGDPLRYHSHFTLTVLESPTSPIMPLDIVSYGRLATGVKKAHLLASWSDETQTAQYYSLEWASMG